MTCCQCIGKWARQNTRRTLYIYFLFFFALCSVKRSVTDAAAASRHSTVVSRGAKVRVEMRVGVLGGLEDSGQGQCIKKCDVDM
eukprot:4347889-Karenia_brevis.AAC.1